MKNGGEENLTDNLIDFSKFVPDNQSGIDCEAAKKYFIEEILPYVGEASLKRLINANLSKNQHLVQLEMMRMFIEAELRKPAETDISKLRLFFTETNAAKLDSEIPGK